MGIRDDIWTDVAAAFDEDLSDAVQAFTFTRVTNGEIDPITGQTTGGSSVAVSGRGVLGSYKQSELGGTSESPQGQHVLRTDTKLIALQSEVVDDAGVMVKPEEGDRIVYAGGSPEVIYVAQDPASATWTLQLRET